MDLVLHDGGNTESADTCVKCYMAPPAVRMISAGKCFFCHATHCLAFGELPWSVPFLNMQPNSQIQNHIPTQLSQIPRQTICYQAKPYGKLAGRPSLNSLMRFSWPSAVSWMVSLFPRIGSQSRSSSLVGKGASFAGVSNQSARPAQSPLQPRLVHQEKEVLVSTKAFHKGILPATVFPRPK